MQKILPTMTANDVIAFVQLLNQNNIEVVIDGGWAVDALLGQQTRPHNDLDIAIEHKDVPKIRTLLETRGYADVPTDDQRDCNFVMGDAHGHLIDFHSFTFDSEGKLIFGVPYPLDSLNGRGNILGFPVRCITPAWLVQFHTGYPIDENDYKDVKNLCQHFQLPIPADYAAYVERDEENVLPC